MKERPILFSGPMVRAILDGSKTQTRRVAKEFDEMPNLDGILQRFPHQNGCRHGSPGDRLWVRETFAMNEAKAGPPVVYRADHGEAQSVFVERPHSAEWDVVVTRWRPSIFMPRAASRILLEITDVRVQRLQEISEEDARAEGCEPFAYPRDRFQGLWDTIHGSGAWHANPWVWAITFRRIQP
jgi:hypothetical protein